MNLFQFVNVFLYVLIQLKEKVLIQLKEKLIKKEEKKVKKVKKLKKIKIKIYKSPSDSYRIAGFCQY